jgi:hypothetical protein
VLLALQGGPDTPAARQFTVGNVTVVTTTRLEPLGRRLGAIAAAPQQWLGLGRVALGPLTLAIVPDQRTFQRWSRGRLPAWGAGMALPSSGMILLRADGGDAEVTLRHELAHLALHRKVTVRVPLWFDEGYAVLAAREYGGLAALQLNLAVAAGRVPTLPALDAALRGNEGDATAAYALAASAVAELGRRHPTGTLNPLLERLASGTGFEDAVLATTGLTADRFADTWHLATRRRYNWGIWLATGGVWVVLALLLAWAKAYRRQLDAPRREALNVGWTLPPDDEPITTATIPPNPLDPPELSR